MHKHEHTKFLTKIKPNRETQMGKAWKAYTKAQKKDLGALLVGWVVECRWAHPFWGNYFLGVIHLRQEAGLPKPVINLPGATHEVWLYAMDPRRTPNPDSPGSMLLRPANYIGQFRCAEDKFAIDQIDRCVDEMLEGKLNPDTDSVRQWVNRFSDSNFIR